MEISWKKLPQKWEQDCLNMESFISFIQKAFPQSTENHLATLIGVPPKTCRNWLDGSSRPSSESLSRIIAVFGPQFIQASFNRHLDWVDQSCMDQKRKNLEAQRLLIEQELASLTNESE